MQPTELVGGGVGLAVEIVEPRRTAGVVVRQRGLRDRSTAWTHAVTGAVHGANATCGCDRERGCSAVVPSESATSSMCIVSRQPQPPQPPNRGRPPAMPSGPSTWSRPIVWALIGMVLIAFLLSGLLGGKKSNQIDYIPDFINRVNAGQVKEVDIYEGNTTKINGKTTDNKEFSTTGPSQIPDKDQELLRAKNVNVKFHAPSSNIL